MSHEYQIPNLVLDETDKQILTILHEEGRISYTDLGKRVDLSRVAVQARINQLIEAGVIEKFTAVINPAKIGIHVSVFFNVEVEPQFLEEVALKLAWKMKTHCGRRSGTALKWWCQLGALILTSCQSLNRWGSKHGSSVQTAPSFTIPRAGFIITKRLIRNGRMTFSHGLSRKTIIMRYSQVQRFIRRKTAENFLMLSSTDSEAQIRKRIFLSLSRRPRCNTANRALLTLTPFKSCLKPMSQSIFTIFSAFLSSKKS